MGDFAANRIFGSSNRLQVAQRTAVASRSFDEILLAPESTGECSELKIYNFVFYMIEH
jgi:hypothetical protein